jgi:hypothetical protein
MGMTGARVPAVVASVRARVVRAARSGFGEVVLLAVWTLIVTRSYLNRDTDVIPAGRDFVLTTLGHHLWDHARHCGTCALWNGDVRGGAPAFVDTLGAPLHPVVAITTLLWGVVNGAKATIVVCFFLAGLGQWLLGRELGLGRAARLWGGAMAIAAGNLFGPLSGGLVPVVAANASFTLLFAAAVGVARGGSRRLTVLAGALLALLVVSGQGYIQVGFALSLPVFVILAADRDGRWRPVAREFALAAGLGVLLAAPLLVPLAHFWPELAKPGDPGFSRSQPFGFLPLNFVIHDWNFYQGDALHKQPFPEWYLNFVGWPAVVLAVVGLAVLARRGLGRPAVFLGVYAVAVLWIASAAPFRWLYEHADGHETLRAFASGIRTPSLIAGMAVCPLLALAMTGLDGLLRRPPPERRLRLSLGATADRAASTIWIDHRALVAVIAVLALLQIRSVSREWLGTVEIDSAQVDRVLAALSTPDLQWVQAPYGESQWITAAIDRGDKIAFYHRPWDWKDRPDPTPVLVASRGEQPGLVMQEQLGDGVTIYAAPPGEEYAAIDRVDGGRTDCTARGEGGEIDVSCDAPAGGLLVVREHAGAGWRARVDGKERSFAGEGSWLALEVPAGPVEVQLRYRPWDVPVGIGLMVVGLLIAGYWLVRPGGRSHAPDSASRGDPEAISPEPAGPGTVGDMNDGATEEDGWTGPPAAAALTHGDGDGLR